ncbi:MAG: L-serine ammonia-lyase [Anaerolineae bacterium]|nr:L-serine ammonia-lyase [Anaerolineae bacterium]
MESIRELFRIGTGPSSSHTMGPRKAAEQFRERNERNHQAHSYRVTLFGSLAATGRGHLTDVAITEALAPFVVDIVWVPERELPLHPNGMQFESLAPSGAVIATWQVYSVGGGKLREEGVVESTAPVYDMSTMADILEYCEFRGLALWEYVQQCEGREIWDFLGAVWDTMSQAIENGLQTEGVLPGGLGVSRKAWTFYRRAKMTGLHFKRTELLSAYALASAEENAGGGLIVTAPTCGSCGVLPAVLRYVQEILGCHQDAVLRAMATAGLIGNLVKHNASISGAEVGCQGEIGTACAMAAGAATQLMGGTIRQVEYAAEMGLEHHLGLTCDPVAGLVQIPCIERNAFAATRALTGADYALFSDGSHRIPFDEVVAVMKQTGHDLPSLYRETASGGLAAAYQHRREAKVPSSKGS